MEKITLQHYYKGFLSLRGAIAVVIGILPLSSFLPADWGIYSFPPLGEHSVYWKILSFISILLVSIAIYQFQHKEFVRVPESRGKLIIPLILCILAFGTTLGVTYMIFVHRIHVKAIKETVLVSVGYERSEFGKQTQYSSLTDKEVLLKNGTDERVVEKFWTSDSTVKVRVSMYLMYLFLLISLTAVSCFLVLFNLIDNSGEKSTDEEDPTNEEPVDQ